MRRVLVYATGVLPLSQTFVADQARALRRWSPELVGRELIPNGLEIDDLLAPEMHVQNEHSTVVRAVQRATSQVPVLAEVVRRRRPELIHAHFLNGGFEVLRSLRPPPCPVVVTAHGWDATWTGSPPATWRPRQWLHGAHRRWLLHQDVRLIAVSSYIRDQLIGFGADPDRIDVHYTGVDTSYFTPPPSGASRDGVLFVGRLVPKKGALDLLVAVARLRAEGLDPRVEIIGDGPQRRTLEEFIARERLDVTLRGALPRRDVLDAMQRAAVLCNPSRMGPDGDREGFGMVLAEAQATGLPVVATRSGGMVDAVDDGRTGVLVAEADPPALAAALHACLIDDSRRSDLGAAARPWVVEHFDLTRQCARLEELYDRWAA